MKFNFFKRKQKQNNEPEKPIHIEKKPTNWQIRMQKLNNSVHALDDILVNNDCIGLCTITHFESTDAGIGEVTQSVLVNEDSELYAMLHHPQHEDKTIHNVPVLQTRVSKSDEPFFSHLQPEDNEHRNLYLTHDNSDDKWYKWVDYYTEPEDNAVDYRVAYKDVTVHKTDRISYKSNYNIHHDATHDLHVGREFYAEGFDLDIPYPGKVTARDKSGESQIDDIKLNFSGLSEQNKQL